jgi:hypothetical protein
VLATVDGSPVSPSAAVVNANRYEVRFVRAVADFCAGGIPSAEAVATLTGQYGRRAPGAAAAFNEGSPDDRPENDTDAAAAIS